MQSDQITLKAHCGCGTWFSTTRDQTTAAAVLGNALGHASACNHILSLAGEVRPPATDKELNVAPANRP